MRFARVLLPDTDTVAAVRREGEQYVELARGEDALLDLIRAGGPDPAATGARHEVAGVTVLAPLRRPGKIVAIGLNYADHTAETGLAAPQRPLSFAKYPSAVIGPGDAIRVPAAITTQADWEVELAAVIGTRCGPDRPGILADVGWWTVANDVSARDLQFADQQWSRSKSIDTFCPLGPELVDAAEFGHPGGHRLWTDVNGERMQDGTTDDLIFDVPALLAHLTTTMTLEPGDVILTGTPPGVGGFRSPPVFLADGDVVSVGVEGIGTLTNPVVHG